jgi:hypothetical protein
MQGFDARLQCAKTNPINSFMETGTVTIVAIIMVVASSALRWRFPAVPKRLASAIFGAAVAAIIWTQCPVKTEQSWIVPVAFCFGVAAIAAALDRLATRGAANSAPSSSQTPPTTFVKSDGNANIDLEDSYSSADTFLDVKGPANITAKRNSHAPRSGPKR